MCYLENAGVSLGYKPSPRLNPCPRKENTSGSPGILGVGSAFLGLSRNRQEDCQSQSAKQDPISKTKKVHPDENHLGYLKSKTKSLGSLP